MPMITAPAGSEKPKLVPFRYCVGKPPGDVEAYASSLACALAGSDHAAVPKDASLTTVPGLFGPAVNACAGAIMPSDTAQNRDSERTLLRLIMLDRRCAIRNPPRCGDGPMLAV